MQNEGDSGIVYVLNDNTVQRRSVRLGGQMKIIASIHFDFAQCEEDPDVIGRILKHLDNHPARGPPGSVSSASAAPAGT